MAVQNPSARHNDRITNITTLPTKQDGQPNTQQQIIKRKKPLYVVMYYTGKGGAQMQRAANNKAMRLKQADGSHPTNRDYRVIEQFDFLLVKDFKTIWTTIYNKTSTPDANYILHEIHIFGHSLPNFLQLRGSAEIIDDAVVKTLEPLNWHPTKGALVLHSCRSGRFEDQDDKKLKLERFCIARSFSTAQQTKVIGQMTYAKFNVITSLDSVKYYSPMINHALVDWANVGNIVLWAYKTGNSVQSIHGNTAEYKVLADEQLWPCRVFNKGIDQAYNYGRDQFNEADLTYI